VIVQGRVLDEKGQPLFGATVDEKGKSNSTTTGADGRFSLEVSGSESVLTISFVGYKTMEVKVGNQTSIEVRMTLANDSLSDIVVIGYGTVKKKDVTGSVVTVDSKDFLPGTVTSAENLLAGKVPGLSVTPGSGAPGSGAAIYIRGISSLNANQRPLIVVDGIPLDGNGITGSVNTLGLINPNDIEAISVLKDASATAIYGSRASGGVILITTKKGSRGNKLNVTFNSNNALAVKTKSLDVLSANQFRAIIDTIGSPEQKAALGNANTNWNDEIFRPAFVTDNSLSLSGGIRNLPYRLSIGQLNQNGTLRTGYYNRYTGKLTINPSLLNNHLNVTVNLLGSLERNRIADEDAINAAAIYAPTQPVYMEGSPYGGYFEYIDPDGFVNAKNPFNPMGILQSLKKSSANKFMGNIVADYRFHFLPELRANLNLAVENTDGKYSEYHPLTQASYARSGGSRYAREQGKRNKTAEFYLNYNKAFRSIKSTVDLTAGYGYYDFKYGVPAYVSTNLNGDVIWTNNADSAQNTLISYYLRLNYKFNDRLMLTGTVRTDGSSRFAPATRWGTFPSGALAYQFINNPNSKLNSLKARIGYGITGQQDIGSYYAYIPTYTIAPTNNAYYINGNFINGYTPGGYNTGLKWESTSIANFAVDFGLFNNRLSGSLEFYKKKTSDMLINAKLPAGANLASSIFQNIGSMENTGVEFSINSTPVKTKNFQWDANFYITYNENKVTKLTQYSQPDFQGYPVGSVQIIKVGYPAYSFISYQQRYDKGKPIENGYVDFNGDGIINADDRYIGKSPLPKYIMGFSSSVQYKKFNAGLVARANMGNYVYNNYAAAAGHQTWMAGTFLTAVNASSSILQTNFKTLQTYSDYYIQNASFLKFDNISAGYHVGKILNNVADLTISAVVQNAIVFTKYSGVDPEIA
ncbi:MAG TPA: SusC/RagA family TonB-linked outer membrane protein, partial [Flavihumibacter sp.]